MGCMHQMQSRFNIQMRFNKVNEVLYAINSIGRRNLVARKSGEGFNVENAAIGKICTGYLTNAKRKGKPLFTV